MNQRHITVSDEQWENYIKSVIPAPIYEVEPNINEVEDLNSIQIKNYRLKNQIEEPKIFGCKCGCRRYKKCNE